MSPTERVCEQCGARFAPSKQWARFCGEACRIRAFRASKRSAEPTAALQRAMQKAITALRTNENQRAALAEVRRELDAFDAVAGPALTIAPTRHLHLVAPAKKKAPVQQTNMFDEPAPAAAPAASSSPDLRARYDAAISAGHAQKQIAQAIGFRDGSSLSHWVAGRKALPAERAAALAAYLEQKGL